MKGTARSLVWVLVFCLGAASLVAAETGFIQVKCPPGVQIFLDGNLKGITAANVGGLIMQDVAPGRHEIRAAKPGSQPQTETVTVEAGRVVSFTVKPFAPAVKISEEGDEQKTEVRAKVGMLVVQSLPIECKLTIERLGISGKAKRKDRWKVDGMPIGKYQIAGNALGKELVGTVEIRQDMTSEIFLNFVTGKVELPVARAGSVSASGKELVLALPGSGAVKLRMKLIPAGRFTMGSPTHEGGRGGDEGPMHEVFISRSFYMGVFEVTQAQWQAVMGNNPSQFVGQPENPVEKVSWADCQAFIRKLNGMGIGTFRLPTEAEWEYACRAGTKTAYSFGGDASKLKEYANYDKTPKWGGKSTAPVGSFKPNPWGLHDMHGNVWEWCNDRSGEYSPGRQTDPKGAAGGSRRVLRGGGWGNDAQRCRSAYRSRFSPSFRLADLGFRLVRAVQ